MSEAAKRAGFRRRLFGAELVRNACSFATGSSAEGRTRVIAPLAYAGHYAHHASGGGLDWLAEVVVRGVLYSAIGRVMRSLTLTEALIVAAIAVVAFTAYQQRA